MAARPDDKQGDLVAPFGADHLSANAQVVVEAHEGLLVMCNGAVAGVLGPGRHTLSVQSYPFLQNLQDPTGGFRMTLLFVSQRVRGVQFGGRIDSMVDNQGGEGGATLFGTYSLDVIDPARLVMQLVGADGDSQAAISWVTAQLKQLLEGCLVEWVSGGYYTIQNAQTAARKLVEAVPPHCAHFAEYGLKLLSIDNLKIQMR